MVGYGLFWLCLVDSEVGLYLGGVVVGVGVGVSLGGGYVVFFSWVIYICWV